MNHTVQYTTPLQQLTGPSQYLEGPLELVIGVLLTPIFEGQGKTMYDGAWTSKCSHKYLKIIIELHQQPQYILQEYFLVTAKNWFSYIVSA